MNLLERLSMSARFLFTGKAFANFTPLWKQDQPAYPDAQFETLARLGYRKNELINACILHTANTVSQVRLEIIRKKTGQVLDEHPAARLLQRPNKFMSGTVFWQSVLVFQRLAGRAAFEIERGGRNYPFALWSLRPDWLLPVPNEESFLSRYRFAPPGADPVLIDAANVLDFLLFDPLDQYNSYPPTAVAARVGEIDNSATDFIRLFFQNGGMPPIYLKTQKRIAGPLKDALREQWREKYGGMRSWFEPAILDEDFEVKKTGLSFDEMGFEVLDARSEIRICMTLRTPPLLVHAKAGLDRATYNNAPFIRQAWWEDTLIPEYRALLDVINDRFIPEWGDESIEARWDFSHVPALQGRLAEVWARAREAFMTGAITVNEYREMIDRPTLGTAGEVFLRTVAQTEIPARVGAKSFLVNVSRETLAHEHAFEDTKARQPHPHRAILNGYEAQLSDETKAYMKTQLDEIKTKLKQTYGA